MALSFAKGANGGGIAIYPDNPGVYNSALDIRHITGATEGYDMAYDSSFLYAWEPAIDFYSEVSFDPWRLSDDARGPDSYSSSFCADH